MPRDDALADGSIVQLDPAYDDRGFGGCLLVVTEVRSWGVIGFVQFPGGGQASYRAATGTFRPTGGRAVWVTESVGEPEGEV